MTVIAPAGPMPVDTYRSGLAILAARYELVHVHEPKEVRSSLSYLADEDQKRADEINEAFRNSEIEAIFCARGGYGCMRILDRLDSDAFVKQRPVLVGFSDITVLHAWARLRRVPTIHGPVVTQLAQLPEEEVHALFDLLEGRAMPCLKGLETLVPGAAHGPLFGGNLTLLCHLCGTPYFPDLRGTILLLEETNEAPYRIDRMLTHLRLTGVLEKLTGIVLGEFHQCNGLHKEKAPSDEIRSILWDRLKDLGIPIALGAPFGHGAHNLALPLGVMTCLDATAGTLFFEDKLF